MTECQSHNLVAEDLVRFRRTIVRSIVVFDNEVIKNWNCLGVFAHLLADQKVERLLLGKKLEVYEFQVAG